MWIELDDSVPMVHPQPSVAVTAALDAMALASFQGKHVLAGSRETLQWLFHQGIGAASKAAVTRSLATFAERGTLKDTLSAKLHVDGSGSEVTRDSSGAWRVPISLLHGVTLDSAELLAEDLRDVQALKLAAQHYKKINRLRGLDLSVKPSHGGGSQILACFKTSIHERQRFTFAVTDSDRDHPLDTSNPISRECAKVALEANWVCQHTELPCHEVENLLPFNLVQDWITETPEHAHLLSNLAKLVDIEKKRPDAFKYIDLKNGMHGRIASESEPTVSRRRFWKRVTTDCGLTGTICNDTCSSAACQCEISPGLGGAIVQGFLDHCNRVSISKQIERVRTSHLKEEWLSIGKRVFDWTIADPICRS